jgi:L-threonylcarbamoyladenylate synthase
MADTGIDTKRAAELLRVGELVAIPTETVYGLAGNALNMDSVTKIFQVKNRPSFDPLIVHISEPPALSNFVKNIPEKAFLLAERYWPGPLTLLLDKKEIVPDLVTSGLNRVAIRCPNHPLTLDLLKKIPFPLAAPSANPFGYVSPTNAAHVNDQLGDKIHYILDGGTCEVGLESTIVGFENDVPVIYRLGGLPVEDVERITGKVRITSHSSSNPLAPGQLKSHYAPGKKVIVGVIEELLVQHSHVSYGILSFKKDYQVKNQYILSRHGSLEEAARNFFTALRMLDKLPMDIILAELVPDEGLGRAINDRLRRAASTES